MANSEGGAGSDEQANYDAMVGGVALYADARRGLLQIAGKDRASWLHNLCTQNIKVLQPGDGIYAFALNLKGRILFDMSIWVDPDCIWLDVDRRWLAAALKHFNKYIVVEDVQVTDCSDRFSRLVLLGPGGQDLLSRLGASNAHAMGYWQHMRIDLRNHPEGMAGEQSLSSTSCRLVRSDLYGVPAVEISVTAESAEAWTKNLLDCRKVDGIRLVGLDALNVRRMEAGIPWPIGDINEEILPAETRQLERAVNFQKGCYLGQEIVERMRSRGGLARSWVGLELADAVQEWSAADRPVLMRGEQSTGFLTSAGYSWNLKKWIGLGYVRVADSMPGTELTVSTTAKRESACLVELPFLR